MRRRVRLLAAALLCFGVVWIARLPLRSTRGLSAEYFSNPAWQGTPALSALDSEITIDQATRRWGGAPPPLFSARWTGYLTVLSPGTYQFALSSDDGSSLSIDNRLIVDNGGVHGLQTAVGSAALESGPHLVTITYFQTGGDAALAWEWGRGAGLSAVPGWRLTPRRIATRTVVLFHALDWAETILGAGILILLVLLVSDAAPAVQTTSVGQMVRAHPWAASLLLFAALAIVETWPLASNPAVLSRNDNGDTLLNEWIIAWIAHQAPRAPFHLFDANIFYPDRHTLAYSEAMLFQGTIAAPLFWLGASPVLAYNLVLVAGFALTGWVWSVVLARWTGDWAAGIAGGVMAAFNAHSLTRLPHLQAQHVEFLPLALVALDALINEPRLRHALLLALWFTLQALTSYYLLVITTFGLLAAAAVRTEVWRADRRGALLRNLAGAAGLALLLLTPYLLPYYRAYREQGFRRVPANVLAAVWQDYLTTAARFDHWVLERWSANNGFFPGFICLGLVAGAVITGRAVRNPRARMCLALAICGATLSFGTGLPGFETVYRFFPPLWGIRAAARFGYLVLVGLAAIAAFALSDLRRRLRGRRWEPSIVCAALGLIVLETLAAPIHYVSFDGIPAIYGRLDGDRGAAVAEFPMASPRGIAFNGPYLINSTRHWHPMLNGYSGFVPASYVAHYEATRDFPSPAAIEALRAYGVRYVFVHFDALGVPRESVDRSPGLRRIASEGSIALYEVIGA